MVRNEKRKLKEEEIELKVRIFTDGACSENPGPGGWGAVFNREESIDEIHGYEVETTNNRMELKAVVEAFKKILKEHTRDMEYELFSDSAYVVNSINNNWIENWRMNGWKTTRGEDIKNKDLWLMFLKLRGKLLEKNIQLTISKVKGHSGNTFNEYVDKIAKEQVLVARREGK